MYGPRNDVFDMVWLVSLKGGCHLEDESVGEGIVFKWISNKAGSCSWRGHWQIEAKVLDLLDLRATSDELSDWQFVGEDSLAWSQNIRCRSITMPESAEFARTVAKIGTREPHVWHALRVCSASVDRRASFYGQLVVNSPYTGSEILLICGCLEFVVPCLIWEMSGETENN
jgi:hypothetical protein